MKFLGCLKVNVTRFFWCPKYTECYSFPIKTDLRTKFISLSVNAFRQISRNPINCPGSFIAQVFRLCCFSKVFQSVVISDVINVINGMLRPVIIMHKPNNSMFNIPMLLNTKQPASKMLVSISRSIACLSIEKKPSMAVVDKQFISFFLREITQ